MQNLTRGSRELFRRTPDECFESLGALANHCQAQKAASLDRWQPPQGFSLLPTGAGLQLQLGGDGAFALNDWSFGQLAKLAGVSKETVNRLTPETAARVFAETLPRGQKPLQAFTEADRVRSLQGTSYTRLFNADLVRMLQEFAVDFGPPQTGLTGATGLYCGEQDLFCFLIDPTGWTEIDGEAFAPGFFLWNSEVGKRSIGIQTFWFQAVCQNHIVWDAIEVVEFTRKHTASVHESFAEIRRIVEGLVARRDARRDSFLQVIRRAMVTKLGEDAEEVLKALAQHGIPRKAAQEALAIAQQQGRFTVFSLVDALTRLAGELTFAGDRVEADQRASSLLELVA